MKTKYKHKAYGYCPLHGVGSCVHVQFQSKLENSPEFKKRLKERLFSFVEATNKILPMIKFVNKK